MNLPRGSPSASGVIGLPQVLLAPCIDQGIAGATVKAHYVVSQLRAQHREVGDAAQIKHGNGFTATAKYHLVKQWHQRCTLATGSHITAAEISHYVDAGELGQQRRVIE